MQQPLYHYPDRSPVEELRCQPGLIPDVHSPSMHSHPHHKYQTSQDVPYSARSSSGTRQWMHSTKTSLDSPGNMSTGDHGHAYNNLQEADAYYLDRGDYSGLEQMPIPHSAYPMSDVGVYHDYQTGWNTNNHGSLGISEGVLGRPSNFWSNPCHNMILCRK